ncbi:hypothetical protein SCLARK_00959 [Spiroplasma clarkii]|nr:hypothetical protein SCLARK_00959 [Spiroplasma clarkii]
MNLLECFAINVRGDNYGSKKIYEDIVVSLFNIIKNEKLRTKIALNLEYKTKAISLVNDLLALEKDYDCSFKDTNWSQIYAKAIVNVTKEKLKFEKPDDKSETDIYADYADTLTVSLNLYNVPKEVLMSNNLEITAEEIKLNSKVTEQMKSLYTEQVEETTEVLPIVEVVDKNSEQPNTNPKNQFFQDGFGGQQVNFGDIPIPPLQNPRFYPYRSKPKNMKYFKLVSGCIFALLTLIFVIGEIVILSQSVKVSIVENPDFFSGWIFITDKKIEELILPIMTGFTGANTQVLSYFTVLIGLASGTGVAYFLLTKPRHYRDQFRISWMIVFYALFFVIITGMKYITSAKYIWPAMVNQSTFEVNLKSSFEAAARAANVEWGYVSSSVSNVTGWDANIRSIYQMFLDTNSIKLAAIFLWIEMAISFLALVVVITLLFYNPATDRNKVMRAVSEYQKAMGEAMNGRKYKMDPTLFEDEDVIRDFYESKNNPKESDEK